MVPRSASASCKTAELSGGDQALADGNTHGAAHEGEVEGRNHHLATAQLAVGDDDRVSSREVLAFASLSRSL